MVEISKSGSGEGPGWETGPGYSTGVRTLAGQVRQRAYSSDVFPCVRGPSDQNFVAMGYCLGRIVKPTCIACALAVLSLFVATSPAAAAGKHGGDSKQSQERAARKACL